VEDGSTYSGILMDYSMDLVQSAMLASRDICRRPPSICPKKTGSRVVLLSEGNPINAPMSADLS